MELLQQSDIHPPEWDVWFMCPLYHMFYQRWSLLVFEELDDSVEPLFMLMVL